jgi:hypothetical protein
MITVGVDAVCRYLPAVEARLRLNLASSDNDCTVIVCYGGAKFTDRHLACIIHCVNDEIFERLERRERRRRGSEPSWLRDELP